MDDELLQSSMMIKTLLCATLLFSPQARAGDISCCSTSPDTVRQLGMQAILQRQLISTTIESGVTVSSDNHLPFWLRANRFGSTPLRGKAMFVVITASKAYKPWARVVDWGYDIQGRVNMGVKNQLILTSAYLKGKIGPFEVRAGRSKQLSGLVDSTLSSGAFAVSGNALGIPKVEISIPEFYSIRFLNNIVAVKGNLAHGWLGTMAVNQIREKLSPARTYFHQKSLYVRLGRPGGWLKLYGGFNHQVFWGNERIVYGQKFTLSPIASYKYVLTGKTMQARVNGFEKGKLGNHLGSIDIGGEIRTGDLNFFFYRQNFYDVGALSKLANIKDGLNGISVSNLGDGDSPVQWKKIVLEFLYTKSQAGEMNARYTKSGDENYYNGFYKEGWSYKGVGLGTPFISTRKSTRRNFPNDPRDYFNNNRVAVVHVGAALQVFGFAMWSKISYSQNFGTYGTSPEGHSRGNIRHPNHGLFPESQQISGLVDIQKPIGKATVLSCMFAVDRGKLLYNASGAEISLKKILR